MEYITNPILSGFNPDPSILRVGSDYYIATSTFEWFPGVQIHHSRDLVHWKLITRPLNRVSQLDMSGNPCSGGIWAPCLTYDHGLFYLIYTNVKYFDEIVKDCCNYLVTATRIDGEWSEPVILNGSGFDPSLFHDDNGRKWLTNMLWDFRKGQNRFGGILLQEYSVTEQRLIGPVHNIFKGTKIGLTEAPHLYKKDGYYYLLTAEGGTFQGHAVTMARSRKIAGPYEVDPHNPVLTSRNDCNLPLQRAGHGSLVETENGEWYLAHLCGRPLLSRGRCILGRETALQKMVWNADGWIRLAAGENKPLVSVPAPALPRHVWPAEPIRDDFDSKILNIHFQTLRQPLGEEILSLKERPGYLRLKGRESLHSNHVQSLVARRQQAFVYTASTCVEFEPDTFQQMAGLVCLYNALNYYYLCITYDENVGKCLSLLIRDNRQLDSGLKQPLPLNGIDRCYLKVKVAYDQLQFYYSLNGSVWTAVGEVLDASKLSDEYLEYIRFEGFTGAFVGLCCQDLSGRRQPADFDFFEYAEE
jgi:xylan 1,4-beta-xylosidase